MKLLFIIIALLISGILAGAQADEWVEYHQYIKQEDAKPKPFISFQDAPLTREDMMIKRAMQHKACNHLEAVAIDGAAPAVGIVPPIHKIAGDDEVVLPTSKEQMRIYAKGN